MSSIVRTTLSTSGRSAAAVNASIWAIGDSITANGYGPPAAGQAYQLSTQSYLLWACLQSMGSLQFGGIAATGGYTTAQILTDHLPTVLTARPAYCVVHAGTNDIGTLTTAQSITNLQTIFDALLAAGITPVGTTMLPKQSLLGDSRAPLNAMSAFVFRYGNTKNFPVVDFTSTLMDPSTSGWTAYSGGTGTYNVDDTHPNGAGAKIMGKRLADTLAEFVPPRAPFLPQYNVQGKSGASPDVYFFPTYDNALHLTDTNADGVPDRWSPNSGTGVVYSRTDMSAGEGVGKWFNIGQNGATSPFPQAVTDMAVTAGHRLLVSMKIKTSGIVGSGAKWHIKAMDNAFASLWLVPDMDQDLTLGVVSLEWVVPTGGGRDLSHLRFAVYVDGRTSGTPTVSIGQVGIYDLTAMGLA